MQFERLQAALQKYHPSPDLTLLKEAYDYAYAQHRGQVRASGDHFTLIDPAHPDWLLAVEALPALIAGELPRP